MLLAQRKGHIYSGISQILGSAPSLGLKTWTLLQVWEPDIFPPILVNYSHLVLIRKTFWTKSVEKQLRAVGRNWCWRNSFTGTQAFRINKQTWPTLLARGNVSHLFCPHSLHRIFLVRFIFICKQRKSRAYAQWKHLPFGFWCTQLSLRWKVYFFHQFH